MNAGPKADSPVVSFVIRTCNSEASLSGCLESVQCQHYPEDRVELVVVDEGSTDGTLDVARFYHAQVAHNAVGTLLSAIRLGCEQATGEIVFLLAAESALPRVDWIRLMLPPMQAEPAADVVFTRYLAAPGDNPFTRYLTRLHADPALWFLFGRRTDPADYIAGSTPNGRGTAPLRFEGRPRPPVSVHQGLGFRRELAAHLPERGDEWTPFFAFLRQGLTFSYVPAAGMYHPRVEGPRRWIADQRRRETGAIPPDPGGAASARREFRQSLFLAYALTGVLPAIDGLSMALLTRDPGMLWHGPATFCQGWIQLYRGTRGTTVRTGG